MARWAALCCVLFALAVPSSALAVPFQWGEATDVAVAPDGRDVYVSGSFTTSFRVDESGHLSLNGYTEPFTQSLAITPDGRFVYGAPTFHSGVHILARDAATGVLTHLATYTAPNDPAAEAGLINQLELSADGQQLYALESGALVVYDRDAVTGALALRQMMFKEDLGGAVPEHMAVSGDGRNVYLGSVPFNYSNAIGTLRVEDDGSLSYVGATGGIGSSFAVLAVAPDGKRVYAGQSDYDVFDRDTGTGALTHVGRAHVVDQSCEACDEGRLISVAPDGGAVFSAQESTNKLVQATPTADGVTTAHEYVDGQDGADGLDNPAALGWSPDGKLAFVVASQFFTREWDGSLLRWSGAARNSTLASYRRTADGLELVDVAGPNPDVPESPFPGGGFVTRPGVTIDDGATYTNDRRVDVKVTRDPFASSLRIANVASGLANGALRRITRREAHYAWQLDPGPSARSVKRVFIRFTPGYASELGEPVDISDDIILDETDPQVVSATADGSTLLVAARDNRSGVAKLQVARDRSHPGRLRAFSRRVELTHPAAGVSVRVVDGAGNRSAWRRAK
jgi:6-phosphogluconolactonase (cycloisomerase 2 family)